MTSTATMTPIEVKKVIDDMKNAAKKHAQTPETARKFLASTGIYTKKGNLKKAYK